MPISAPRNKLLLKMMATKYMRYSDIKVQPGNYRE